MSLRPRERAVARVRLPWGAVIEVNADEGIGRDLFGPKLTPGAAAPRVDRRWESPSYLATLAPREADVALRARGWQVLRAC
jgi:hypothetical protein